MAVADLLDSTELELLLPWHATGTLTNREASCIERCLAVFPDLAQRLHQIERERIDIARAGESLGRPSARPLARLLATINSRCASKRRMARAGAAAQGLIVHLSSVSSPE